MKRILLVVTLACALLAPAAAYAGSTTAYSTVAPRWANLKTVVYWSLPSSTSLRVSSVSVTVTSTHLGAHQVRLFHVQFKAGTTAVCDCMNIETHWVYNMGSVTHSFYPNLYMRRGVVNRAGTRVRFIANADLGSLGCDVTTPFYWTANFL